jgi:hypothetical protein
MSNWKHAYGWSGHILVSKDQQDSDPNDNLVAVDDSAFNRLMSDHDNCKLDSRIQVERIGIIDSDYNFLACGSGFSEGFAHYGTVFQEADARSSPGPFEIDRDSEYMNAMKQIYGLDLPPCRLMIGCASEH